MVGYAEGREGLGRKNKPNEELPATGGLRLLHPSAQRQVEKRRRRRERERERERRRVPVCWTGLDENSSSPVLPGRTVAVGVMPFPTWTSRQGYDWRPVRDKRERKNQTASEHESLRRTTRGKADPHPSCHRSAGVLKAPSWSAPLPLHPPSSKSDAYLLHPFFNQSSSP
jgi:hypothetical protein